MRREWFTKDDLDWLFSREKYCRNNELKNDYNPPSVVIIPDRVSLTLAFLAHSTMY